MDNELYKKLAARVGGPVTFRKGQNLERGMLVEVAAGSHWVTVRQGETEKLVPAVWIFVDLT